MNINIIDELELLIRDVKSNADCISCVLNLNPNFSGFIGHFDNNPIFPAICYNLVTKTILKRIFKQNKITIQEVKEAKFFKPAKANDTLEVNISIDKRIDINNNLSQINVETLFTN